MGKPPIACWSGENVRFAGLLLVRECVCMCVYVYVCICMCMRVCMHACVLTNIFTYIFTYVLIYLLTPEHLYTPILSTPCLSNYSGADQNKKEKFGQTADPDAGGAGTHKGLSLLPSDPLFARMQVRE